MGKSKKPNPFDQKCEKIIASYMHEVAFGLDTFRLPFGKNKQERLIRKMYRKTDKVLNRSTRRINNRGEIEQL